MVRIWFGKEDAVLEVTFDNESTFFSYDKGRRTNGKYGNPTGFTRYAQLTAKAKPAICDNLKNLILDGLDHDKIWSAGEKAEFGLRLHDPNKFNHKPFFKGTTLLGKAENSFSYVAKLLKTGLPHGIEVKSNVIFYWTCSDLVSYIEKIRRALPLTVNTIAS